MMSNSGPQTQLYPLFEAALERRQRLLSELAQAQTDCYRLFHGTVEGEAGLTIDRYGPQLIIQSFHRCLSENELAAIIAFYRQQLELELAPFYHDRTRSQHAPQRAKRELETSETIDTESVCRELGVNYRTRGVHRGLDPLLFLDLRAGRRFVQQHAQGRSVLNLFAYTCGVGVCAAHAGAKRVVNIDFASSSLSVGQENATLNALAPSQIDFIQSDFFPAVRQLAGLPVKFRRRRDGRPPKPYPKLDPEQFDLVFLDPPRWAKSPFGTVDLIRDYPSVFKPSLLATRPGGRLVCCNNVAQVERQGWVEQLQRSAAKAGRPVRSVELIEPEGDFPSLDNNPPLKIAVLEV